jgi:hypothetical protein
MTKGGKVAVGVATLAALTAVGAFLWSKNAQASTSSSSSTSGATPGAPSSNLPVCLQFVPSTADPAAVTMANAILNGSGPVPYQAGTSYQTMINGRLWQFNMGSGLTNAGPGVEATVCTQTQ